MAEGVGQRAERGVWNLLSDWVTKRLRNRRSEINVQSSEVGNQMSGYYFKNILFIGLSN